MGDQKCRICGKYFGHAADAKGRMDELVTARKWLIGEDYPQRYTSDQIVVCEGHTAFQIKVYIATRSKEDMPGG